MQRLVGPRQFIQHFQQDKPGVRCGDEFALIINNANHELPALLVLRLDDIPQRNAEVIERDISRDEADQVITG